jgi:HlyD family secretion protein
MRAITFVGIFAVVAAAAAGCGERRDPSRIVSSGHIEATDVRISAKVGGRILRLAVREGDRVGKGQELAEIDTVDTRLALQEAVAERARAQADLALRLAGARPEEIAEAEADAARAAAELEGARKDLDRMQGLLDREAGTAKARDDASTRSEVAAKSLEAARERLRRLRAGSRKEEIDAARARLAGADARIGTFRQQIEDARVASPLSGIVTEKVAEEGELVAPGQVLLVVTDLSDPWLTVYIGEPDLGRVRIGQEAEVVTDAGQTRTGKITFVSTTAEFTPKNVQTRDERVKLVFKVKVALENRDGLFKPGMPAEARFRAQEDRR